VEVEDIGLKKQPHDSEDYSVLERGVDPELLQELKKDILEQVSRLESKIDSATLLSERLFGGLTEE